MLEYFFQCPHCWEDISMLIDTSQHQQNYIEDCEICCNPLQVDVATNGVEIINFDVNSIEQ
jgi:transcription elongation factor Elf1